MATPGGSSDTADPAAQNPQPPERAFSVVNDRSAPPMSSRTRRFVTDLVRTEAVADRGRDRPLRLDGARATVVAEHGPDDQVVVLAGDDDICLVGVGAGRWYACAPAASASDPDHPMSALAQDSTGTTYSYTLVPDGVADVTAERDDGFESVPVRRNVAVVNAQGLRAVRWGSSTVKPPPR